MKTYFTFALIILMALTSMGIFGFLSKAHLDQSVPTSDVAAKISIIDEKIKTERENIESSRKALKQMDDTVDQTIARSKTDQGAVNANAMRTRQAKERTQIQTDITKAQGEIAKLNNERAPIASELRKVEAEVGPIKYIAALIYGDNPDQTILEKAVRIVIIMIVIVFDPLAVLLLMAAGMPVLKRKENDTRNQTSSEEVRTEETTQTSPSIIKERFVTKFAERPKEPYVGQQPTSSSEPSTVDDRRNASPSSDTNSSGTSAGVTTRTEDLSTEQNKVSVWDVNSGKEIDYDSIGRRITPPIPGELLETKQKTIEVEVEELQTDKKV
jgi:hypothetical protein